MSALQHAAERVLRSIWTYRLVALVITHIFWWSGITKALSFDAAVAEMAHSGLRPPALFAVGVIGLQLLGSAVLIMGHRLSWLAALALGGFTLMTVPIAHPFWTREAGPIRLLEQALVADHVAVVGGLLAAAMVVAMRRT